MKLYKLSIVFILLLLSNQNNVQKKFFKDIISKDIPSDLNIVWQQFGPGMSGNNKAAFWHPTDTKTLYVSPNMGNSYITTDGGHTYNTVLNEDGSDNRNGERGPREFASIDFSRQNPSFGFCTDLKAKNLCTTFNKGKNWVPHKGSTKYFGNSYLSVITVDPTNDKIWYVGAGRMRYTGKFLFTKNKPHGTYKILRVKEKYGKLPIKVKRGN